MELLGVFLGLCAATSYGVGTAMQALEARQVPDDHSLRVSLITRLFQKKRFIVGSIIGTLGWFFQAAALKFAPLAVVQPTLAFTLVVLLLMGVRILKEKVGPREVAAIALVVVGIVGVTATFTENRHSYAREAGLFVAVLALAAVATAPYIMNAFRKIGPIAASISAGVGFALGGIATDFLVIDLSSGRTAATVVWGAVAAAGFGIGFLSEMTALQLSAATKAIPTVYMLEILVPVGLAPFIAGETVPGGAAALTLFIVSLTAVISGAVVLARSRIVAAASG